jgi:hypothetical protein
MQEALLILATVAQRFDLRLVLGHPVEPEPLITLRPKFSVKMTLHPVGGGQTVPPGTEEERLCQALDQTR